jgi:hypothetical protein
LRCAEKITRLQSAAANWFNQQLLTAGVVLFVIGSNGESCEVLL